MRTFIKNCYSIYLTLYLLWWVSAVIIISEEGFNFVQDAPWFLLFTSLLVILWVMKYFFTEDSNIFFHKNIAFLNIAAHLLIILIMSAAMVYFK